LDAAALSMGIETGDLSMSDGEVEKLPSLVLLIGA
jgi:hypothetical protein